MLKYLAAAALALTATPGFAATVLVAYDPAAPTSNFGTPGPTNATTAYSVTTTQDAERLNVALQSFGPQSGVIPAANIYFSNGVSTFLGIEVTNNRAFRPGVDGYYDLTGTGFAFGTTGSIAGGDLGIDFSLPFSFFRDDPLGIGFQRISGAEGDDFLRISLSQSFGYSVAGGATFGRDRLGSFDVPAAGAVPEPATWGMMVLGVGMMGATLRRGSRRRTQLATA